MHSTSLLPCTLTMISNFAIILSFKYSFSNLKKKYNRFLHFHMIPSSLLLTISFFFFLKLIIFIACSLKNSLNIFIQAFCLYTSCLFSMVLNEDTVGIKKPEGICLLIFVVDELYSGLFSHPSIFSFLHLRSA